MINVEYEEIVVPNIPNAQDENATIRTVKMSKKSTSEPDALFKTFIRTITLWLSLSKRSIRMVEQ